MRVGIGLPNSIPGCDGRLLIEWAQRAEDQGFASLATIDRLAFPSHEPMTTLSGVAAVTHKVELLANVIVAPTRNAVLLAKQAATVEAISGGRFVLGLGVGDRADDFELAGTPYRARGRRTDQMIELLQRSWSGDPVPGSAEPVVASPIEVPIVVGGHREPSLVRAARYGVGWTSGGLPPDQVAPLIAQLHICWRQAGRSGAPRVIALTYFSLGDDALQTALAYLRHYYGFYGAQAEETAIIAGALTTKQALTAALRAYEGAGVDDLVLNPTVAQVEQVDRLADAIW